MLAWRRLGKIAQTSPPTGGRNRKLSDMQACVKRRSFSIDGVRGAACCPSRPWTRGTDVTMPAGTSVPAAGSPSFNTGLPVSTTCRTSCRISRNTCDAAHWASVRALAQLQLQSVETCTSAAIADCCWYCHYNS
jgi:hypothetical protein